MRRLNQRMRLNAVRREVPHPAGVPKSASVLAPRSAGCRSWLGPLIAVPLLLVFISWLLWDQAQIGRVLLFGVPAAGTVVAVNQCSRATAGDVTIVFTDARGDLRRVKHSSYTPGCFFTYHEGEAITVRYVPSDPGVLMTQPELGGLWLSVLIFSVFDVLFLGGGGVAFFLVFLPWVSGRVSTLRPQAHV